MIRSPGRGSLVQPAETPIAATAASASVAHAAAGASTVAEPAKENLGPPPRAIPAAADFRHCFQIVPACALTHAAASDWITAQPMSLASASIPIVAAALARKTQPRPSLTEEEHAEARQQLLDHASSDSALSLDPALLLEYDQLNDVSPALSDGRSRPDTLPSVSISEHTGTTGSKLRHNADTGTSGAGLLIGSASPHMASKEGHTPERSASERSRLSDSRSHAAAPAAASPSSAASAQVVKKPAKAPKDVFAFGSQSSQSQDSTPRSSQQQIVIPSTASAAVAPPTAASVGPSYTLPSRRVASSDEVILIPDSQPAADAGAPTPSPPPSIRISASTQPSTASALAPATVAPALAISPSSTPGDSRMSHSTRSLGATAGLTFDASVVPPSLSSLHTHVVSRQPAGLVDISFAHLDAIDSDMRRMDAEVANMDARARLHGAAEAPALPPSPQDSPAAEEGPDAHMESESQAPQFLPHLHPLSSSTPPLGQSSFDQSSLDQSSFGRPGPGRRSLGTVPPSFSTTLSTVHTVGSLVPDVHPVPPAIINQHDQLYNGQQSESERSGQLSEEQRQVAAELQARPMPSAVAPPSHDPSPLFAATPPTRRSSAAASDGPMHLQLSGTPQLAAVAHALPSSASFSSPSIGTASSRSSGGAAAASHAPLPPVAEDAAASLAAPSVSPPLSPRSPTLSELQAPMDEGRDAAASSEAPSQPAELASMSLELNFDDEEEGEAQTAAAQPQQQALTDADMNDPLPAVVAEAVAVEAAAVSFPLVLNVSPLPPPTAAERPLSQALPELAAVAPPAAADAAGLDPAAPLPLLTPPHPASIISPPNSAATTLVQKATPSSGRSSTAQAAHSAVAPLPAMSAPAEDVHSATQHLSLPLVSPMKSHSSPAKPPSALQSPIKHLPMQRVAKQLRFGEQTPAPAAAAPQPRSPMIEPPAAAAPSSVAPDLASASCFAVPMESFSPCTPPGRSFDSTSHPSSLGSALGVVSASPPEHTMEEAPADEEQKSGEPAAAAAATAAPAAVQDAASGSAAVVAVAWSRSRRAVEEDASMEVSEIEDRRGSYSSTGAASATASAEKRARGKSFSKQPKSARSIDGVTVPIDLVSQAPVVRPVLNLITEKPVTISLLSESQPEESQAELSVDPMRRARAARAKKEAQAAIAASKENTQHVNAAASVVEPAVAPVRAATSPIKVPISPVHVPTVSPTPAPAAPVTVVRPRTPVASAAAAAATAITPRSGGSSPAPSSRRSVSPLLQSPLTLPPPPPRAVPHHYASARKIIVHTTVVRSPAAAVATTDATRSPTPRLSPSAAAQAARQMVSPPPARSAEVKSPAAPIVNEELPQRPKFPAAPLSVILEETSSMGSFSLPAASVAAAAAASSAAASQRRSDSIVSRQSTSTPAASASLPDPNAAAPMDIDLSQPAAPVVPVVPPRPEVINIVSPTPPPPNVASTSLPAALTDSNAAAAAAAPPSILPQAVSSRKRRAPAAAASSSAGASESPVDESSQASTDSKRAKKTLISAPAGAPSLARAGSRRRGSSPVEAAAAASSSSAAVAAASFSAPSKQLRNSLLKGLVFLLTGLPKASRSPKSGGAAASSASTLESITKLIVQHGGRCVDSLADLPAPSDATLLSPQIVVVASEPKRTMKFMYSLARGLPPLQPAWLHACVAESALAVPTEAHLVPLKSEEGIASQYPSSWLRSLRDRAFMTPLALSKRILSGLRVAVCGPAAVVSEVSVVCREAGARVWSCSSDEDEETWTAWNTDSDEDSSRSSAAASSSTGSSRSSRRSVKDSSSAAAAAAAPSSSVTLLPAIDVVCTDSSESVSAWMQRSLSGASVRGHKRSSASCLPPVVSVKWLIQCLMLQKRISDSERDEFTIQL